MVAAFAALLLASFDAEAQARKRARASNWQPGFATIVVDAKTGKVLDSDHPDEPRHPASLAKIMTLYLLFEEIETGRLKLKSKLKISAEAAAQPPSKLNLKPGESIEVGEAIKALVTRSANDIAVAVAEVISGDEESFAQLMTRNARALGMKNTRFTNASGLPDPAQITTARDLALLGLALQDRFPKLYPYFATRTFRWRGVNIGNHNRLLNSALGIDGIKTGYTRASGFNLVTNVKRGNRHIVAVVLGGRTGAVRNELMRELIAENLHLASTGPRTAPRYAAAPKPAVSPPSTTAAIRPPHPPPGSIDPIRPLPVKTVPMGKSGEPLPPADDKPAAMDVLPVSSFGGASLKQPLQITPFPATTSVPAAQAANAAPAARRSAPLPLPPSLLPGTPTETASAVQIAAAPQTTASADEKPAPAKGGWLIQIGAYTKESEAHARLAEARERAAAILSKVRSYSEKTVKGTTAYFRARFAGFDEASAKRACDTLKKSDFACFATKN